MLIQVAIYNQILISKISDISIKLEEENSGTETIDSRQIEWKFQLNLKEEKTISFKNSAKYSK
ncbi:hypothetical protein [Aureivirga marina]|uniref:hypothetical protein n=1 Tax=Aureivirga marina TaxID=1182451 RepID=UPI0018C99ECB|nr:hypothetical protein [Aureivirga marina]